MTAPIHKTFEVTITYLDMQVRPSKPLPPAPKGKNALLRLENCTLSFYRYLYNLVGEEWHWVLRRYMTDDLLLPIIRNPDVHLYCLYVGGVPAGMAEIDARRETRPDGDVEIKYFGLSREFMGLGLGKWFLANTIDIAWALDPTKVVIETCTADSAAALPLYQKMGFSPYSQGTGIIEWRG